VLELMLLLEKILCWQCILLMGFEQRRKDLKALAGGFLKIKKEFIFGCFCERNLPQQSSPHSWSRKKTGIVVHGLYTQA